MSLSQIVWGLMIDEAARARQVNDLKDEPFFPARCMISLSNISSFVHCKACNGISIWCCCFYFSFLLSILINFVWLLFGIALLNCCYFLRKNYLENNSVVTTCMDLLRMDLNQYIDWWLDWLVMLSWLCFPRRLAANRRLLRSPPQHIPQILHLAAWIRFLRRLVDGQREEALDGAYKIWLLR